MTHRTTIRSFFFITALTLINLIYASSTLAAESTITVTSTPFLAFTDIPDSFVLGTFPYTIPVTDTYYFSDSSGVLPSSRSLTVQDTRENGGFILQLSAEEFQPSPPIDFRDDLKIVSTGASDLYGDLTPVNGIIYLPADGETSFIGDQTVSAPIDSPNINFDDSATFDSVSGNTLNTTVDLMDGCLTSGGRKGKMNVHLAFDALIPKYTVPPSSGDQYYTTLVYTLSDYTPASCP